jgi:hypothetical protein
LRKLQNDYLTNNHKDPMLKITNNQKPNNQQENDEILLIISSISIFLGSIFMLNKCLSKYFWNSNIV